jgi:hypothetical protein
MRSGQQLPVAASCLSHIATRRAQRALPIIGTESVLPTERSELMTIWDMSSCDELIVISTENVASSIEGDASHDSRAYMGPISVGWLVLIEQEPVECVVIACLSWDIVLVHESCPVWSSVAV